MLWELFSRKLTVLFVTVILQFQRYRGREGGGVGLLSIAAASGPWLPRVTPNTAVKAVCLIVPGVSLRYSSLPNPASPSSAVLNHVEHSSLPSITSFPFPHFMCEVAGTGEKEKVRETRVRFLLSSKCLFCSLFHFQIMPSEELSLRKLLLSNFPLKIEFWHLTSFWCCLRSLPFLKDPASHIQVEAPGICCRQVRVKPWSFFYLGAIVERSDFGALIPGVGKSMKRSFPVRKDFTDPYSVDLSLFQ